MNNLYNKNEKQDPYNFGKRIKEFLLETENAYVEEEIIWTIKQIYKKKNKITGIKKSKEK